MTDGSIDAALARAEADARAGCRPPPRTNRSRRAASSRATGSSASGRAAGAAAGRAGSRPSRGVAGGRRSRPAGCASRSTSTTWSRRSVEPGPASPGAAGGHDRRWRGAPPRSGAQSSPRRSTCAARGWRRRSRRSSRYLDDAGLAGLGKVTIIHGLGTGALRDAVRDAAAGHPLVGSVRPGERGEGGDGATIVSF